MREYQVLSLEEYNRPVDEEKIEAVINTMIQQGWKFTRLSSGGGGESGSFMCRVYMIFESEK